MEAVLKIRSFSGKVSKGSTKRLANALLPANDRDNEVTLSTVPASNVIVPKSDYSRVCGGTMTWLLAVRK